MCKKCKQTICCCIKIISRIGKSGKSGKKGKNSTVAGPEGPPGPPGADGNVGIYFHAFGSTALNDGNTLFTHTITLAGNYILQYESYMTKDTNTSISSRLMKNGSYQSLNANNLHKTTSPAGVAEITYAHTAKLTSLIVGDVVGYSVFCNTGGLATATNSSLTLIKV